MKRIIRCLVVVFILVITNTAIAEKPKKVEMHQKRAVLGYAEKVMVGKSGVMLEALLSPGHKRTELGVQDLRIITGSKGKKFAQYRLEGRKGKKVKIKSKILSETKRGVMVRLPLCIGSYALHPEFLLTTRDSYEQELRIGRRVLSGRVIVDPSMSHASTPTCKKLSEEEEEDKEMSEETVEAPKEEKKTEKK